MVTSIGAAIGIGGAALIFSCDRSESLHSEFHLVCSHDADTWWSRFVFSILVGLISVIYSAYRVSGMTIAEALRSTE